MRLAPLHNSYFLTFNTHTSSRQCRGCVERKKKTAIILKSARTIPTAVSRHIAERPDVDILLWSLSLKIKAKVGGANQWRRSANYYISRLAKKEKNLRKNWHQKIWAVTSATSSPNSRSANRFLFCVCRAPKAGTTVYSCPIIDPVSANTRVRTKKTLSLGATPSGKFDRTILLVVGTVACASGNSSAEPRESRTKKIAQDSFMHGANLPSHFPLSLHTLPLHNGNFVHQSETERSLQKQ